MAGLSNTHHALDAELLARNREQLRPVGRWSPTAPMPDDPSTCRWCDLKLIAVIEGDPPTHCQNGCALNDVAPYLGHCDHCRREFNTGKQRATLCDPCERIDVARHRQPVTEGRTYHFSRYGRGRYRD